MKDKYNMTRQENIFLAKRNIVENIYNSAKLEGLNITFPETYAIFEKARLSNVDISTVNTILNLKHAWQHVLSNINNPLDLDFILSVHSEVSKDEALFWGVLRNGKVGISGTDYIPPIPNKKEVILKLKSFQEIQSNTDRAIERMLWMMKAQLFWDGNKRTAMLIANKDLISHGKGIITINEKNLYEFNVLLNRFYSFGEKETLKTFIFENGLQGISLKKEKTQKGEPFLDKNEDKII